LEEDKKASGYEVIRKFSHELVNPLTVVVGYAQILNSRDDLPAPIKQYAVKIEEQAKVCLSVVESILSSAEKKEEAVKTPAAAPGANRRKVAIVDDENVILKLAYEVLSPELDVSTFHSGDEAIERILEDDFDLIVVDLKMPGKFDGLGIFKELQARAPAKIERLCFFTGAGTQDEIDAIKFTKRPYLQKPFDIRKFKEFINERIPA